MQFAAAGVDDAASIDHLLDKCFGTDRHQRTAYLLRRGAQPIAGPTMVVREHGQIIASVQYWPVALVNDAGRPYALTLLGPIGVDPDQRGRGIGVELMHKSLAVADALGCGPVVLIGDVEYYTRFGFSADATAGWKLPGPVEQHRVLLRNPGRVNLPKVARLLACADAYIAAPSV